MGGWVIEVDGRKQVENLNYSMEQHTQHTHHTAILSIFSMAASNSDSWGAVTQWMHWR